MPQRGQALPKAGLAKSCHRALQSGADEILPLSFAKLSSIGSPAQRAAQPLSTGTPLRATGRRSTWLASLPGPGCCCAQTEAPAPTFQTVHGAPEPTSPELRPSALSATPSSSLHPLPGKTDRDMSCSFPELLAVPSSRLQREETDGNINKMVQNKTLSASAPWTGSAAERPGRAGPVRARVPQARARARRKGRAAAPPGGHGRAGGAGELRGSCSSCRSCNSCSSRNAWNPAAGMELR